MGLNFLGEPKKGLLKIEFLWLGERPRTNLGEETRLKFSILMKKNEKPTFKTEQFYLFYTLIQQLLRIEEKEMENCEKAVTPF